MDSAQWQQAAKLKSAEVEYLFVDYLKDWTSLARVPLPLP
jgi:hypothetical protein